MKTKIKEGLTVEEKYYKSRDIVAQTQVWVPYM